MHMCYAVNEQRVFVDLQVTPLLSELREGNMVNNLEDLTRSASEAAADIHRLQDEVTITNPLPYSTTLILYLAQALSSCMCASADAVRTVYEMPSMTYP